MRLVADADPAVHRCSTGPRTSSLDPAAPALRRVSKHGHIADTPLSASGLYITVKRRAAAAGLDTDRIGFHSLRAGFVTQARRNGSDYRSVRNQTRHTSDRMVDVYDRDHNPLRDNAVANLGL